MLLSLSVVTAVLLTALVVIAPLPLHAANTTSCVGNNLFVDSNHNNGFGSFRVNGTSGPNIPATIDNAGNVTIAGPGSWVGLFIEQHNGVDYSFWETVGNWTCPSASFPSATAVNRASPNPSTAASVNFSVVFNASVTGVDTTDFTPVGTGGVTGTITGVTGSGANYTVSVNVLGSGTLGLNLVDNDSIVNGTSVPLGGAGAGNGNFTGEVYTVDYTPPAVGINQAGGQADPTNAQPINFSVFFSEPVTGFGSFCLFSSVGGATYSVTGSGTTYNVAVSGLTNSATVTLSVIGFCVADAQGTPNAPSTSTDNTVVFDITPPTVTINQAPGQADPTNASPVNFRVVFSEPVTGFAANDVTLGGTAGATTATVTGSGTTYNVAVAGMTGSGTVTATVAANAAADAVGNQSVASSSTDNTVTYDVTPPTVTINQAGTQVDPTNVSPINFAVLFSEPITGFAANDVTLGGTAGATTAIVTGSGTTYNVAVSGMTGSGTVTATVAANAAADAAGNLSGASSSTDNTVTYDITGPTVIVNQAAGQVDPTNVSPIVFDVLFGEPVTDFMTGDVTLGGTAGATMATVTGSGGAYTISVSGMTGSGTIVVNIPPGAATDPLGNGSSASSSTDNTVTYDITGPTVIVNQAAGQVDPTGASPILFDVLFGEPVTDFMTGDVTLGGTAGATTATVTGSGAVYTISVSGMASDGTVIVSIPPGAATDPLGNGSNASTSTDNTVIYDTMPPTVTINQAAGQTDPTNISPINFTVVFSESVTNFATGDVTLGGTAGATTGTVTGSGTTYNVAVAGMTGSGTIVASIVGGVAVDVAGNGNGASTSADNTVAYDITGPVVTVNQAAAQADPTNVSPINFTVYFDEPVTDFMTGDVTLGGTAGATIAIVTGSGAAYNVAVSGMTGDGTVVVTIPPAAATDPLGNPSSASTSIDNTVTYDGTPPTVTINQSAGQADPTSAAPINFTVIFSEPVTGFAANDVTLGGTAGATTAVVTGSGTTYNAAVTGMTNFGTVIANLVVGASTDAAGNASAAATSVDNTVIYTDSNTPGVIIDPTTLTITENGPLQSYTVRLNSRPLVGEIVTITLGVSAADIIASIPTLTFDNNSWNTPQSVDVLAPDNAVGDGTRMPTITHAVSGSDATTPYGNGSVTAATVTVTVLDDDIPAVRVIPTSLSLHDGAPSRSYQVSLATPPTVGTVSVTVTFPAGLLRVNGGSMPVSLTFADTTPQTVTVQALDFAAPRSATITHAITASGAAEYPLTMSVPAVTVTIAQTALYPDPPPATACSDVNFEEPGMMRSNFTNDADRSGLHCRLIAADGGYMSWFGGALTSAANVGNQTVLDLGVIAAVDVFSFTSASGFVGDVNICLKGSGYMIYLNAEGAPRVPQLWSAWTTDAFPGYTCTTLYAPGTVVLVATHP